MSALINSKLDIPDGPLAFEKMVCSCAQIHWESESFRLNGRQGQAQNGPDIFGRARDGRFIGIQCKNTPEKFSMNVIEAEVRKAASFGRDFDLYCIATSAKTNTRIQQQVLRLSDAREAKGLFLVDILFWDHLTSILCLDKARLYMHYPEKAPAPAPSARLSRDQALFARFETALPFNPTVRMFADHDFHAPFPWLHVTTLNTFLDEWRSTVTSFQDKVLRAGFLDLYTAADALATELHDRTSFFGERCNQIWVVPELVRERPNKHDLEDARELNRLVAAFVATYEAFNDQCQKILFS
ncbi:hypothetical protein OIV56_13705 [Burkholderia pseudomallei]|uniref:hypothetical protein n=1 Tax=Burkholderia pseudomallei TaxID=28450 RepID=UPI0021F7326D|nr:hypothetical protein [Burkholderia pseudomallei]MCW0163782.1 hypothetical protein [Burkholderia pseudomallei]